MTREWYLKNKEKCNARNIKWAKEDKDKVKIIQKKYKDNNKEKSKEYNNTYQLTANSIYSQLGKRKRRPVLITKEKFIKWYDTQEKKCGYCDIPVEKMAEFPLFFSGSINNRLSIDRIDNDKDYEEGNLILSCRRCNSIKSDFFSFSEMREIAQKYIKLKWK